MTLAELCEPLFQFVCRQNRAARKGGSTEYAILRSEIKAIFTEMKTKSLDNQLVDQYDKVEMPLMFFVDSMVSESALGAAAEWNQNRLAYERNELAGDEKFFDLLEETLADPTEAATDRLQVFYTAMGLGFMGWYAGQPDYIKQKMREIAARIRPRMQADKNARICDDAYRHTDTRNLIEPPGTKLWGIVIALVGLIIVLFLANGLLYEKASNELEQSLTTVINHEKTLTGQDLEEQK